MSSRLRVPLLLLAASLMAPQVASAQGCSAADKAAGLCLIPSSPTSTTVTAAAAGVGQGGTPVVAAARYLGGIAYFQSDVYFFQGFFGSGFNPFNPLVNAADYTYIGGKPENSSTINPGSPWVQLPGVYASTQELVFGLRVNTYDFNTQTHTVNWYYSGYGWVRQNNNGRATQDGNFELGFANVFLNGGAPVSDELVFGSGNRAGAPATWTSAWSNGGGYFGGPSDAVLGWEDEAGWSDGDFNDAVIALDFATVPEPGSVALVGLGLAAVVAAARRKRQA